MLFVSFLRKETDTVVRLPEQTRDFQRRNAISRRFHIVGFPTELDDSLSGVNQSAVLNFPLVFLFGYRPVFHTTEPRCSFPSLSFFSHQPNA